MPATTTTVFTTFSFEDIQDAILLGASQAGHPVSEDTKAEIKCETDGSGRVTKLWSELTTVVRAAAPPDSGQPGQPNPPAAPAAGEAATEILSGIEPSSPRSDSNASG